MAYRARPGLNKQVHEEACAWFVHYRSGDLDPLARREFDRWLRKSPQHLGAYLEIATIWNEGPVLDRERRWDSATLVTEATADAGNVIPLLEPTRVKAPAATFDAPPARPSRASRVRATGGAGKQRQLFVIAAAIAFAVLGVWIWLQPLRAPTYATGFGEQRFIVLADGSTVDLNSRSRIRVHYSRHERSVELLEGQALFHVAKDASRPFTVTSNRTLIRAVGTQFDVYRKRAGTVVTVVEGRVAILTGERAAGSADPGSLAAQQPAAGSLYGAAGLVIAAGEQATVTADVATKSSRPDVARATAWTERQLIFESTSLIEAAEEFNRYNVRQLVIEDATLQNMHISGVFSSTDPRSLVRFLHELGVARVSETPAEIRIAKKVSSNER